MRHVLTVLALAACTSTSPPVVHGSTRAGAGGGRGALAPASWIGLTVGQVLAQCGTPDSELRMRDEPPGKLRGVDFVCHRLEPARRVNLEFEYHAGLFSTERDWASELVKAQRVTRVPESHDSGW